MNRKELQYRNAQDHFIKVVRENGDGTAMREALEAYQEASDRVHCTFRKNCAYETDTCKPDTCHWASHFYRGLRD